VCVSIFKGCVYQVYAGWQWCTLTGCVRWLPVVEEVFPDLSFNASAISAYAPCIPL